MGHLNPEDESGISESSMSICSRDDYRPNGERSDGLYEERFRVDRRKLESMLGAGIEEDGDVAERFFRRIMEDTETSITWPTRLKPGAKSKKDPHVRVVGALDAVQAARERIMAVLDTRQTSRVTMKIEVSWTDHSHLIGRSGNTISRVMDVTGCHIHFPDSNRTNTSEKSNQVSITGEMSGAERARARIRDLMPIVLTFEVPNTGVDLGLDNTHFLIVKTSSSYGVTINVRHKSRGSAGSIAIKGSDWEVDKLKEATRQLYSFFCQCSPELVSIALEISPAHHPVVLGHNGVNIAQIMKVTNTRIMHLDPTDANTPPLRRGTFTIYGTIDNVLLARQKLIGSLPVILMFDLREEAEPEPQIVTNLMKSLNVLIQIKPKPKQTIKTVIIKGIEFNSSNIYEARRRLLGMEEEPVIATIPSAYYPGIPSDTYNWTMSGCQAQSGQMNQMSFVPQNRYPCPRQEYPPAFQNTNRYPNPAYHAYVNGGTQTPLPCDDLSELNSKIEELHEGFEPGWEAKLLEKVPVDLTVAGQKYLQALHVLKQNPSPHVPRFPTDAFSGYGFSASVATTTQSSTGKVSDEMSNIGVWAGTPASGASAVIKRNRSDFGDLRSIPASSTGPASPNYSVAEVLQELDVLHYYEHFQREDIDLEIFLTLTEADLERLGVKSFGVRRKLARKIEELRKVRFNDSPTVMKTRQISAAPGAERPRQK